MHYLSVLYLKLTSEKLEIIISTTTSVKTLHLHLLYREIPFGSGITKYLMIGSVMYLFSFLVDDCA